MSELSDERKVMIDMVRDGASVREKIIDVMSSAPDEDTLDKILASYLVNCAYNASTVLEVSDEVRRKRGWAK